MSKVDLIDVTLTGSTLVSAINTNNDRIEIAMEKTLSRDGTEPNAMESSLDMNSNRILNVPDPINLHETATKHYVDELAFPDFSSVNISENAFNTAVDVEAATINIAVTHIQTLGYTTVGDGGGARYIRAATEPTHGGKLQSDDGAWWELSEVLPNICMFGGVGNGVTNCNDARDGLIAYAMEKGTKAYWPGGEYLTTTSNADFHSIQHRGLGRVIRGSDTFYVEPWLATTNTIYLSPTGDDDNDGLSASQPLATFQAAFDVLKAYGPMLNGSWAIVAAAGTYTISSGSHNFMTSSVNRVLIRGPSVGGTPNVPTCIIDGGGNTAGFLHGLNFDGIGTYVQVQDIKFQNFTQSSGNQRAGLVGANGADIYTVNVHTYKCSWTGIYFKECSEGRVQGGIIDAGSVGAYGFISDSTHCSFGYGAGGSTSGGPNVKNAISAGVYWSTGSQGHCDYATIEDCGVGFLVAENSRCDTVGDNFKRNTVAIRAQTGGIFASGGSPVEFNDGTADANTTNIEYKAYSGDLSELDDTGSGSWQRVAVDRSARTLSGTSATVLSTPYTIAANRLKGINKSCLIRSFGVFTSATSGSVLRVVIGGMTVTCAVPATATNVPFILEVQLCEAAGGHRAFGSIKQGLNAERLVYSSSGFDSTASQTITIEATLADAGDSMAIYRTEVYLIG